MPVLVSAAYPSQLATFSEKFDLIDVVFADHINALQREVAAVQATLGTLPSGLAVNTVRERLDNIESSVLDISSHFDTGGTFPQTAITGLPAALSGLTSQITGLSAALAALGFQIAALASQKPEAAEVVLLEGEQYIVGLKLFAGLVRMLATQRYSANSTNHAWEIGIPGGRSIKFDNYGWGGYDGSGPADLELQREGGDIFLGGGLRAAGMVGLVAEVIGPKNTTQTSYAPVSGAPSLTLMVPSSGRVSIALTSEGSVPSGSARMGVRVSGANTVAERDLWSTVHSTTVVQGASRSIYLDGLTPGSTTFTTVFRSTLGSLATFANMSLIVVPRM